MATDRLTRQELGWLLAQEARSAANMLRKGVSGLKIEEAPASAEFSLTLDALDDAVKKFSSLQAGGTTHTRRGRIDVASLLLELAPQASINLEPGSGTEVFAEEAELKRMLQVLLTMGAPSGEDRSSIRIRHQEDQIRVEVELGPDSSAIPGIEKAWLHRMAVRHGGLLDFERNIVILRLPAGSEKREVDELRRELAAAQEQGEMYAREIAAMFIQKGQEEALPQVGETSSLASFSGSVAAILSSILAWPQEEWTSKLPLLVDAFKQSSQDRSTWIHIDLEQFLLAVRGAHRERAKSKGITLCGETFSAKIQGDPQQIRLLFTCLFEQAIEAAPDSSSVISSILPGGRGVFFEDHGIAVPVSARGSFLELRGDTPSSERSGVFLLGLAASLATSCGATLFLEDAIEGGFRVSVIFKE